MAGHIWTDASNLVTDSFSYASDRSEGSYAFDAVAWKAKQ